MMTAMKNSLLKQNFNMKKIFHWNKFEKDFNPSYPRPVYGIIRLKSKQLMNEFCFISKYQKELLNYYYANQENSINNNILKSIISKIKPPAIFYIKRKFIDLITYWVIKKMLTNQKR